MSMVELRLSDVEPPAPDPPRTLYTDLVNLPDPVRLGLTCRIFNHDDVGLYMRVDGYNASWSFTTNNLGLLGSGASMYRNLDQFGSRAKPSAAGHESVIVRLRAYTDAGYSDLKWTFTRTLTLVFIDSSDPAYTQDYLNNFDDGTVQGWTALNEAGNGAGYPQLGVVSDYVLSAPYSLRMTSQAPVAGARQVRSRLYKSFTTPDRDEVYAIFDIRNAAQGQCYLKYDRFQRDDVVLVFLGRPFDAGDTGGVYIPVDRWLRALSPLPKNVTVEIRIIQDCYQDAWGPFNAWFWMDDFKIISK